MKSQIVEQQKHWRTETDIRFKRYVKVNVKIYKTMLMYKTQNRIEHNRRSILAHWKNVRVFTIFGQVTAATEVHVFMRFYKWLTFSYNVR